MKKQLCSPCIAILFVFALLFSSCWSHSSTISDYFIINKSGHALTLQTYGTLLSNHDNVIKIDNDNEYSYTEEGYIQHGTAFYDVNDSIVILFDDGKRITYTRPKRKPCGKNIYLPDSYEITEIGTGKKDLHHFQYRFFITSKDYLAAE